MLWLLIAILSYFFFSLASLGDRYLLIGPPRPKVYAFYVGILGIIAVLFIPFVQFSFPDIYQIKLSLLYGLSFVLALLSLYESLERFEVSRIIPALGGLLPIFTFLRAFFALGQEGFFNYQRVASFLLLILGSVLISLDKSFGFSFKSLFFAALSGFLLSSSLVISKIIYSNSDFWTSFISMRVAVFLFALFLLFFKEVRGELFKKKKSFTKKTWPIFILVQSFGGVAVILQNWSVALVQGLYISFVSALQGVQYAFLFVITLLIPNLLKEKTSKRIIFQKAIAILLIGAGLALLAF